MSPLRIAPTGQPCYDCGQSSKQAGKGRRLNAPESSCPRSMSSSQTLCPSALSSSSGLTIIIPPDYVPSAIQGQGLKLGRNGTEADRQAIPAINGDNSHRQ